MAFALMIALVVIVCHIRMEHMLPRHTRTRSVTEP